jgi:hypothetical protein
MGRSNQSNQADSQIRLPDRGEAPQARGVVALLRPWFGRFGAPPEAREPTAQAPCGHTRHLGTCPTCQREQLERWREQLEHAHDAAPTSGEEPRR